MRTPAPRSVLKVGSTISADVEQHALGDLQLEPAGLQAGLAEHVENLLREERRAELHRRDVDRDASNRPAFAGAAGLAQHPIADRVDQPGLLGDRDEDAGRRRRRASDGSSAAAPRRRHIAPESGRIERLVDDLELVAGLERLAQLRFDLAAALDGEVHLLGEDAEAVPPLELGAIERDVGLAHQLGAVDAGVRRDRDADRDADESGVAEKLERAARPPG